MRYEKNGDDVYIYCDDNEDERSVLRAIVRASFELAQPVGMGWLHYNKHSQMTSTDADRYIQINKDTVPEEIAVRMYYVEGRQCKTVIWKEDKGVFRLNTLAYEQDRGKPDNMLNFAKDILEKKFNGRQPS